MDLTEYLGSALSAVAYLAIGIRLLWLGFRERLAVERLLGLTFLAWCLSYVAWVIPFALPFEPSIESHFRIAARVTTNLGNIGIAFFPLYAFRSSGSSWAKWLVAAIVTCVIVGIVGSVWVGDPEGVNPLTNVWWWFEWLSEIAPAIWIGVEGLHAYGTSRPRVRLGLCEPIVSHRFLLWGLAGISWTVLDFVVIAQYVEFWATQSWSALLDFAVGFFELGALSVIWLAYFPPTAYRRWIEAAAPAAEPEEA